jgi:hypothetical protein
MDLLDLSVRSRPVILLVQSGPSDRSDLLDPPRPEILLDLLIRLAQSVLSVR